LLGLRSVGDRHFQHLGRQHLAILKPKYNLAN
jgi:hypothetical protein